ncbi:hypothetical protein Aph01nite_60240 [Acrocarpospora phusangensis]|uniref:RES domain-containing protein n=1 Tax=Acrocarpospora phusangensis TaxID=1070424 RepID=A0A919QGW8_9ACTN|nr:RES family NAD+ phosphorylase [Acrocarpospora phusangensis]GIH27714.1 hypothetical protein Aph01nite_60240 [Acrocarpospora phusangensis]
MPAQEPPDKHAAPAHRLLLPAGTQLWRVHRREYPCDSFTPGRDDPGRSGGRFDGAAADRYDHCYLAYEQSTALAECLLRSVAFDDEGPREISFAQLEGRRLSLVETTRELPLISLASTPALAAVAQDEWLIQAEPPEYPLTRRWAHWMRGHDTGAAGLDWISRRDLPKRSVILFRDRCPDPPLAPTPLHVELDDTAGLAWLDVVLRPYRARVLLR